MNVCIVRRWVELKRGNRISKTVVLVVEGLSSYDFLNQESNCPALQKMDVKAEVSAVGFVKSLNKNIYKYFYWSLLGDRINFQ